jgi:hypothetical protein
MLIVTLDNLAHRYTVLPSEALKRADTFDLYVLNVSTQWHNYKNRDDKDSGSRPKPQLTQEQMKAMLEAVRKQGG